jgi:hypothetical protein
MNKHEIRLRAAAAGWPCVVAGGTAITGEAMWRRELVLSLPAVLEQLARQLDDVEAIAARTPLPLDELHRPVDWNHRRIIGRPRSRVRRPATTTRIGAPPTRRLVVQALSVRSGLVYTGAASIAAARRKGVNLVPIVTKEEAARIDTRRDPHPVTGRVEGAMLRRTEGFLRVRASG